MKRLAVALLAVFLLAAPALAADAAVDPDLAKFRAAYTSGKGLAYVVIKGDKGERLYRYGNASRLAARRDPRGYALFTCARPHMFLQVKPEDKAVLMTARVVKAGDPAFAALDARYLAGCKNPLVKSALPKK